MIIPSDILTPQEALLADATMVLKVIDALHYDFKIGDYYFNPRHPESIHMVATFDESPTGEGILVSTTGSTSIDDEVIPLLSVGQLIELISTRYSFQLQTFDHDWMVIWNNQYIETSEDKEKLQVFLWRVLHKLIMTDRL